MGDTSRKDLLVDTYRPVGRMWGAELLLRHAEAIKFIDDCEVQGLVILGMNYWIDRPNGGVAEENSSDWARINKGPNAGIATVQAARESLKCGLPDGADWVSLVLQDPG